MRVRRSLIAGIASSFWAALCLLLAVPYFLRYLGMEAYGLIGFFAAIQGVLQMLDLGISPTINREVARSAASGGKASNLLHTFSIIYLMIAGLILLLLTVAAPWLAHSWLGASSLPQNTVVQAVMLMGLVIACRWHIALYQGALMGAHRLTTVSIINIAISTTVNGGAVLILAYISPTIEAFFVWQAVVGVLQVFILRWAAWSVIGGKEVAVFDWKELKRLWRFSMGMSGIALSGLAFTHLDKIILSKMLGLAAFGQYMLASLVVSSLYIVVTPFFNTIYPRFSALIANSQGPRLRLFYHVSSSLLASVLFPAAMLLIVFPQDLIAIWTRNADLAKEVAPLVSLLAIGTALHGTMHVPYALQIANGLTRMPLRINVILIICMVPLTTLLAMNYGAMGGALSWILVQLLYLAIGGWMTHRHLLRGEGRGWICSDLGIPLVVTLIAGGGVYIISNQWALARPEKLVFIALLSIAAASISVFLSPQLRVVALMSLRKRSL